MDDKRRIPGKFQKGIRYSGKKWFVRKELLGKTMHFKSALRHVPFGIDVLMKALASGDMVKKFKRPDLHNTVAPVGIKPCCFGIKYDFTHKLSAPRDPIYPCGPEGIMTSALQQCPATNRIFDASGLQ
jgi:hypothetical protein